MFGLTEIEVYERAEGKWHFRIVSGKKNVPICVSVKTYGNGDAAYEGAEQFARLLHKVDEAPRFC